MTTEKKHLRLLVDNETGDGEGAREPSFYEEVLDDAGPLAQAFILHLSELMVRYHYTVASGEVGKKDKLDEVTAKLWQRTAYRVARGMFTVGKKYLSDESIQLSEEMDEGWFAHIRPRRVRWERVFGRIRRRPLSRVVAVAVGFFRGGK